MAKRARQGDSRKHGIESHPSTHPGSGAQCAPLLPSEASVRAAMSSAARATHQFVLSSAPLSAAAFVPFVAPVARSPSVAAHAAALATVLSAASLRLQQHVLAALFALCVLCCMLC